MITDRSGALCNVLNLGYHCSNSSRNDGKHPSSIEKRMPACMARLSLREKTTRYELDRFLACETMA
jgi:hypothetical protein